DLPFEPVLAYSLPDQSGGGDDRGYPRNRHATRGGAAIGWVPLSPAQDGRRAAPPPQGQGERKGVVRSKTEGVRPHSAGSGGRSRPATPDCQGDVIHGIGVEKENLG